MYSMFILFIFYCVLFPGCWCWSLGCSARPDSREGQDTSLPWLLPTAPMSAHTGAAAWLSCWDQELLLLRVSPLPPKRGSRCLLLAPMPWVLLVHCDDAEEAAGLTGCFTLALAALPRSRRMEKDPLFPQECVCVFPPG